MNKSSNVLNTLKFHKGRIYDMDLIDNKDELLSCGMDKNILLWDIKNFTLIKKIYLNSSVHNLIVKYLYINNIYIENKSKEIIFIYSKNQNIYFIDFNNCEIIEKNNIL
jgi:WD40 repeat protein